MKVLLSIRPEFADSILEGTKRYEFRKAIFKDTGVKKVVIYATKPVGKIVGEFSIEQVLEASPEHLWGITKEYAGISREFFDAYFCSRDLGYAIKVVNPRRYAKPRNLEDVVPSGVAPQSFCYVG